MIDNFSCNYADGSFCCNYAGGIFLQCIMHMTVSVVIMLASLSVIAM